LGPWGPIPVLARGGEEAGEGRRRRPATVATATVLSARWQLCGEQEQASELGGVQRKVGEGLICRAVDWSPDLAVSANNGAGGAQGGGGACVRRGKGSSVYRGHARHWPAPRRTGGVRNLADTAAWQVLPAAATTSTRHDANEEATRAGAGSNAARGA
jgi:hypothetical protein